MGEKPTGSAAPKIALTRILEALSDPTRLQIALRLSKESGLCSSFSDLGSKTSLSYHFRILRVAGLTNTEKQGTWHLISLRSSELERAFPGLLKTILKNAETHGSA